MERKFKAGLSLGVVAVVIVIAIAVALIYLRTGQYLYSEDNLTKCQDFTVEQAKMEVLRSRLKNYDGWSSYKEAMVAAGASHISFLDGQIQKEEKSWLIPFTQTNADHVRRYFAILDCGTLTTEYSSEPE